MSEQGQGSKVGTQRSESFDMRSSSKINSHMSLIHDHLDESFGLIRQRPPFSSLRQYRPFVTAFHILDRLRGTSGNFENSFYISVQCHTAN